MLVRMLVATADAGALERLTALLTGPELLVRVAVEPTEIIADFRREPCDVVVLAPAAGEDVPATVASIRALPDAPEVIIITEGSDDENTANILAMGGLAVLDDGIPDADLVAAIESLLQRVRDERRVLTEIELAEGPQDIVAVSQAMRQVLHRVERVAQATSAVLVLGETGVGKERIAELIHRSSGRADGPWIPVNCAAIPSELVESELFGHEKGAFTGAHKTRRGLFELAHDGTLFLDEVAEIPLPQQAKLLRALQEKKIRAVGSDRVTPVDVRVIAATNRDLEVEMAEGRFRRDLYYRLGVVELEIPPLRERPEDIERLLAVNLHGFNRILGRDLQGFTGPAKAALLEYDWPGNVRELINVMERAVLLCLGVQISLEDLPRSIVAPRTRGAVVDPAADLAHTDESATMVLEGATSLAIPETWLQRPWKQVRADLLEQGERIYLAHLLAANEGRVGRAARHAGMAERSLFEKMKRHGLRKEDFRPPNDDSD